MFEDTDPATAARLLQEIFLRMPLHQLLDFRFVPSDDGGVAVEMPVAPAAFNSTGNLHGGAIATLI
jgi:acyl-coenzyme A thioesterase PaaI-like protein